MLELRFGSISDAGLGELTRLTNLRKLFITQVEFNATSGQTSGKRRGELPGLESLFLEKSHLTDLALAGVESLVRLNYLSLRGSYPVTDASLVHVAALKKLEELDLCGTQITDGGLDQLKAMTELRHLYHDETKATQKGIEQLRTSLSGSDIRIHR